MDAADLPLIEEAYATSQSAASPICKPQPWRSDSTVQGLSWSETGFGEWQSIEHAFGVGSLAALGHAYSKSCRTRSHSVRWSERIGNVAHDASIQESEDVLQ